METGAKTVTSISDELHETIDREISAAYGRGADAVWRMLGVGPGLPNDAVFNEATSLYDIVPKKTEKDHGGDRTIEEEWAGIILHHGMLADRLDRLVQRAGCKDRGELMLRFARGGATNGRALRAALNAETSKRAHVKGQRDALAEAIATTRHALIQARAVLDDAAEAAGVTVGDTDHP